MIKILTESKEVCNSGIYKITCLVNEKVYIGSAVDLNKRYSHHLKTLKNKTHCNRHLQNAFNKYGLENFTFEVIQYVPIVARLVFWEQLYLDYYNAANHSYGFNICPKAGSTLGLKHSSEFCVNQSERMKGSKINLGRKHTAETRAKKSEMLQGNQHAKGFKHTAETCIKAVLARKERYSFYFVVTSPNGVIYDLVLDLSKFCRDHNLIRSSMSHVVSGRQKHHKGWQCQRVQKVL